MTNEYLRKCMKKENIQTLTCVDLISRDFPFMSQKSHLQLNGTNGNSRERYWKI